MKILLLAGLYLFFVRVLWSVFSELRDPRTVVRKRKGAGGSPASTVPNHAKQRTGPANVAAAMPATVGPQFQTMPAGPGPAAQPVVPQAQTQAQGHMTIVEPAHLAGTQYALGHELTLGRADTNEIVVDDTYVSSVHARIFGNNGVYYFEDLASRNGSLLNGTPVVATTALVPGDWLQLGATVLEFS